MSGLVRWRGVGQRHHPRHGLRRDWRLAGLAGLVAQQTPDPGFGKTPLPAPHRRSADPDAVGNLSGGCPIRRSKHDPGPRRVFLPPVAIGHDRLQLFPIQSADNHRYCLSHLASIAHSMWFMTLLNGSVH